MTFSEMKAIMVRGATVVVCFLMGWFAFGQTPMFKSFEVSIGKFDVRVQAIAQSDDHQMFVGTNMGVLRYDGLNFHVLDFVDSVKQPSITALAIVDGVLWAGSTKGELFIYTKNRFIPWKHKDVQFEAKVSDMYVLEGNLCVATYGSGVYLIKGDQVEHFSVERGLGDDYTYDIEQQGNSLWIGTDAGITELDVTDLSSYIYTMADGLPDNMVRAISSLNDSMLAIGMYDQGVCLMNTKSYTFDLVMNEERPWTHGAIDCMTTDDEGQTWIGTQKQGLIRSNLDTNDYFIQSFTEINGLKSNRIICLMIDAESNVWIGNNEGLSACMGTQFEYLTKSDGLIGEDVFDVVLDRNGMIWLSTEAGVMSYENGLSGEGIVTSHFETGGSLDRQIVCLFEDDRGKIWMGTYGRGVFVLDPREGKIINLTSEDGITNDNIMDITQDRNGIVWLSTLGGMTALSGAFGDYDIEYVLEPEVLRSSYVYTSFVDSKNQLWIGTDGGGVSVFDCETGQVKPAFGGILSEATIYSITETSDGAVWLSTAEPGLLRYSSGATEIFGVEDGLPEESYLALLSSPEYGLIAIHERGIDVRTLDSDTFQTIPMSEQEFSFVPSLNAAFAFQGAIWIGSENGAVRFERDASHRSNATPKVSLTGLRVLYEPYSFTATSTLDYDQNHLIFDYFGVWMRAPQRVIYRYKLEGFDKQWSFDTKSQVATYSSLPPGEYTFKVMASNGNGVWSDETQSSYSFIILRPFWQKWWFIALVVLGTVGGVFFIFKWRTRMLLKEKQRLEDEVAKRTAEIQNQKDIIETKNDEILSSINYAKRIQSAILPDPAVVAKHLPNSFILYKPKDIVAGDFYWLETVQKDGKEMVLVASADCTGHGVPGAMVSVVCSGALHSATREHGLVHPADILDKVLELVLERFKTTEHDVKDGMDIALCGIHSTDGDKRIVEFSGAQNPLWVISDNQELATHADAIHEANNMTLYEFKGDKQPVGKYGETKPFTNKTVELMKGDMIYIFTDGFADQFGGERGKKFKYKPLKELLLNIQHETLHEQKRHLNKTLEQWRGDIEQIDDVCMIGIRL